MAVTADIAIVGYQLQCAGRMMSNPIANFLMLSELFLVLKGI